MHCHSLSWVFIYFSIGRVFRGGPKGGSQQNINSVSKKRVETYWKSSIGCLVTFYGSSASNLGRCTLLSMLMCYNGCIMEFGVLLWSVLPPSWISEVLTSFCYLPPWLRWFKSSAFRQLWLGRVGSCDLLVVFRLLSLYGCLFSHLFQFPHFTCQWIFPRSSLTCLSSTLYSTPLSVCLLIDTIMCAKGSLPNCGRKGVTCETWQAACVTALQMQRPKVTTQDGLKLKRSN